MMNYDMPSSYFDMDILTRLELAEDRDIMNVMRGTEERRPEPGSIYEKILKLQHQDSIMAKKLKK